MSDVKDILGISGGSPSAPPARFSNRKPPKASAEIAKKPGLFRRTVSILFSYVDASTFFSFSKRE